MNLKKKRLLAALAGSLMVLPLVAGCSASAPPMSKDEQANFKGGPMPESARQIMQQKMQEAQQKRGGAGAPGAPGAPR
jgi:hypothetical protein